MTTTLFPETYYIPSTNVVAREIDGDVIIIPLNGGFGDLTDDLFTLNATGKAIWQLCDGQHTLSQVVDQLCVRHAASREVIERDAYGLVEELCARDILMARPVE